MKTIRNLMLLLLAVSLFSSCLVQDGRGRGRHYHDGYNRGHHKGYYKPNGRPGYW